MRIEPRKFLKQELLINTYENLQFLEKVGTKIKKILHHYKEDTNFPQIKNLTKRGQMIELWDFEARPQNQNYIGEVGQFWKAQLMSSWHGVDFNTCRQWNILCKWWNIRTNRIVFSYWKNILRKKYSWEYFTNGELFDVSGKNIMDMLEYSLGSMYRK